MHIARLFRDESVLLLFQITSLKCEGGETDAKTNRTAHLITPSCNRKTIMCNMCRPQMCLYVGTSQFCSFLSIVWQIITLLFYIPFCIVGTKEHVHVRVYHVYLSTKKVKNKLCMFMVTLGSLFFISLSASFCACASPRTDRTWPVVELKWPACALLVVHPLQPWSEGAWSESVSLTLQFRSFYRKIDTHVQMGYHNAAYKYNLLWDVVL